MKRLSMVLLVALTALALVGPPRIMSMGGCSAYEAAGSTTWCVQ